MPSMSSELQQHWPEIVSIFKRGLRQTRFYVFATTNPDGSAHMAPYASLVLNRDCSGYYSDVFPNRMSRNLAQDPRICVMSLNLGRWSMLKGLFRGHFDNYPGLRLSGTVGENRPAQPGEVERWRVRVRPFRRLKGYDLLWKNVREVRDIFFTRVEPIHLGAMTRHLVLGSG